MTSNILSRVSAGERARASQLNQIIEALVEDAVSRRLDGVPEDNAGSLGNSTNYWLNAYIDGFIYQGNNQGGYAPSGSMFPYSVSSNTPPVGYIFANGDTIGGIGSGATHTGEQFRFLFDQYKLISNYGNSGTEDFDTGGTVRIPNLQDKFVRPAHGLSYRAIGSTQGDGVISHNHSASTTVTVPSVSYNNPSGSNKIGFLHTNYSSSNPSQRAVPSSSSIGYHGTDETRPVNIAFPYIIKI